MLNIQKVTDLRLQAGLTVEKLSAMVGISHTAMYRILRGEGLRLETAAKLARALGVQLEDIMIREATDGQD